MRPNDVEQWSRIRRLFDEASGLDGPERDEFIRVQTAGEPEIANRVRRLLEADRLDSSPVEAVEPAVVELLRPAALMAELGEARVEPYRVTRALGAGGMGAVYLAERSDGSFERTVALKLVHRGFDSAEVLRRFRAERRILAALEHPNIARMYDAGRASDGRPFLVMEHVEGEPIDHYARRKGLDERGRIELFLQVCEAVAYAHAKLVIHRDLKPSNILVDDHGTVKLLDFGVAKLVDDDAMDGGTRTGHRMLTPEYAAPEQLRGDVLSTRADVYALGAVLHELLHGRRPFEDATSALAHAFKGAGAPPAVVMQGTRSGDGDLERIVRKALAHDPADRYDGASTLAADLRRFLEGRPVRARPPTWAYRAGRFVRRHRTGVAASAAAVVLLVTTAAVAVGQARRAAVERDTAVGVSTFLETLFTSADPRGGQTSDTTRLIDFVEQAAVQVRDGLTDQPAVRARLLYVLGSVTRNLSRSDLATPLLTEAVDANRRVHGAGNPDEIEARALLALELTEAGSADAGLAQLDTALTLQIEAEGEDALRTRRLRQRLGQAYATLQRNDEALPHLDAVVRAHRRFEPIDTPGLASALNVYGSVLAQAGRLDGAADALGESADLMAASGANLETGPRALDEGVIRNNLSFVLLQVSRLDEAEQQVRRARELIRPRVPDNHALIARTDIRLAEILSARWRAEPDPALQAEADTLFRRGLALGLQIPEVRGAHLFSASSYANQLRAWGRLGEAEATMREAVAAGVETFGADHPLTLTTESELGRILADAGRYEEALATTERVMGRLREGLPPDAPPLVNAAANRARVLLAAGQRDEARVMLESVEAELGTEHPLRGAIEGLLADAMPSVPDGG